MLTKQLNKAFKKTITGNEFFSNWIPKGSRAFVDKQDKLLREIDLQLDKYWERNRGSVAINITCAHKLDVPLIGWAEEGFDRTSIRLTPEDKTDFWWNIATEESIERFVDEFKALLSSKAIPWFKSVETIEGFLSLDIWSKGRIALFPYQLQYLGKTQFQGEFIHWLKTLPRKADGTFKWATDAGLISESICNDLIEASRQMKTNYEARLPIIIKAIKQ